MKNARHLSIFVFILALGVLPGSLQAEVELPQDPSPDACADADREGKECQRWYQLAKAEQQEKVIVLQNVRFDTGSARIKPTSLSILQRNVRKLKESNERIRIAGYTDSMGGAQMNQELSEARARAVRNYFKVKGIDSDRMVAVGYGETQPVASNETAQGRAKNRRIEIHLY